MDDIKNNGNSDSYSKLYDLKKQLLEEKQKTADMQAQLAAYQETYRQMVDSTSWRVTRPLRKLMEKVKKSPPASDPAAARGAVDMDNTARPGIRETSQVRSLLKKSFHALEPIPALDLGQQHAPRVNLVTDSIEKKLALGGVATALIIATEFAKKNSLPLRIITRVAPANAADYNQLMKINGVEPAADVSFYSDHDRDAEGNKNHKLDVSDSDIFIATSWWGAHAIRRTTKRRRFFYVLQEVETFFYPHGTDHFLCGETMRDSEIDFIINSRYLYDYFAGTLPSVAKNGVYFDPAFPRSLYSAGDFSPKQKHRLFFYARPSNPRNMFLYGIDMLERAIEADILDMAHWDICCAGQDVPPLAFSNGYEAANLGQLSWDAYANMLRDTDLTLSLMYTPHPSYPPYDAACSGSVVLSNKCLNKTEFYGCANVILSGLGQNEFLDSMERAAALAMDMQARKKNYGQMSIPRSWGENLAGVMEFMEGRL